MSDFEENYANYVIAARRSTIGALDEAWLSLAEADFAARGAATPLEALRKIATHNFSVDTSGLSDIFSDESVEESLIDHVKNLIGNACDDAQDLIVIAERVAANHPELDGILPRTLINSRHSLLTPAGLDNDNKKALINGALGTRPLNNHLRSLETDSALEVVPFGDDEFRLRWNKPLRQWIRQAAKSAKGCPAERMLTTDEGGNPTTILHQFWDRVVLLRYLPVE